MKQKTALFYLLSLHLLLLAGVAVFAQNESPEPAPIPMDSPPPQLVPVDAVVQPEPEVIDVELEPFAIDATNDCTSAPTLSVPGGGSQIVNNFDVAPLDPQLNGCFWGAPSSTKGFRTAWYRFTAPHNGIAQIDTLGSTYDTVVAIHRDFDPTDADPACSDLTLVACNDDDNGLTARVELAVEKDTTYYIEVADWKTAVSGNATLQISLEIEDIDSNWTAADSMDLARTRHATAIVDSRIFVIGGQTNVLGNPTITPRIDWYNTLNGNWVELGQMPGVGYSNTTAVFVRRTANDGKCTSGCIYLPGGYDGGNPYNGTHYAYDLATGEWIEREPINDLVAPNRPFAWSAAVALPDQSGYYLVGGLTTQPAITTTAQAHNTLAFYRVADDEWQTTGQPKMNTARFGHMATMIGSRLCVVGGIGTGLVLLPGGECYDFNNPGAGWQPIAPLNEPRYGAGSTFAADGKWYVYGGSDANHRAISSIEAYNPATNGWSKFNVNYDLGASEGILARAWPRGGFVNNHIWAMGGNATEATFPAISLVEKLFIGRSTLNLPILRRGNDGKYDTFATAIGFARNQPVVTNFDSQLDLVDVFFFDLPATEQINVKLSNIPESSNYDIEVYDNNKLLLGSGRNLSNANEDLSLTLAAGRYYVMVKRVFPFGIPDTQKYRLIVE